MSDKKKRKRQTKAPTKSGKGRNGKGDTPRNNLSSSFRRHYDEIDWSGLQEISGKNP